MWLASFNFTRDITVDYIGVPLNVLVACFLGAYFSFGVGEKLPRRQMWGLLPVCIFMGGAFTGAVNFAIAHFMEVTMTGALQASMGAIVSFVTRFFLPWLADVVSKGKWLAWIPWINRSGDK